MTLDELNYLNLKIEFLVGYVFAMHLVSDSIDYHNEGVSAAAYHSLIALLDAAETSLSETTEFLDQDARKSARQPRGSA